LIDYFGPSFVKRGVEVDEGDVRRARLTTSKVIDKIKKSQSIASDVIRVVHNIIFIACHPGASACAPSRRTAP
jgi:DNA-binding cell septation regulator SpoVG